MKIRKRISLFLIICICTNITGCSMASAKKMADSASEKVEGAADMASEKIEDVADTTSKQVEDAADAASNKIDDVSGTASEKIDNISDSASEQMGNVADSARDSAEMAKDSVVNWYSNIDFEKFKNGWNYSMDFMGSHYSSAMSSEYISDVEAALSEIENNINASTGLVSGKSSIGVTNQYDERTSQKYYQNSNKNASAQAIALLEAYCKYCAGNDGQRTLAEYMDERGYDPKEEGALLSSIYEGQNRIIPEKQLQEAKEYIQGNNNELIVIEGDSAATKLLQETLGHLRDCFHTASGTESASLNYDDVQAITELLEKGCFKLEDFGLTVSSILRPTYVLKQAVGTGLSVATMNTVLTVGPDFYSILSEAAQTGHLDEKALEEAGVEGIIAASEGFVEGSLCYVMATLCESGALGETAKKADPEVVSALTILCIEAAIYGNELSRGRITEEEYGNIMADHLMISIISLHASDILSDYLSLSKTAMMAGCMAGAMIATVGYVEAKEAVMDIVDASGFEAVVPADTVGTMSVAKDTVASLNIHDSLSSFKDSVVSTANDGYIKISTITNPE